MASGEHNLVAGHKAHDNGANQLWIEGGEERNSIPAHQLTQVDPAQNTNISSGCKTAEIDDMLTNAALLSIAVAFLLLAACAGISLLDGGTGLLDGTVALCLLS